MKEQSLTFEVAPDDAGRRLDQWLADQTASDLSRNRIQTLIRDGSVKVDGTLVSETRFRLRGLESVTVDVPAPVSALPAAQDIALDVLFEDNDLIVVNKPAGLTVHPGAGQQDSTLVNALLHHCGSTLSGIGGVARPGIVHRLDKDTSGVLVVAKHDAAHQSLSAQFADHGRNGVLERRYLALVWGVPAHPVGRIEAALGRHPSDRTRRAVLPAGRRDAREAITHYTVKERFGSKKKPDVASLVECRLETGRTHQIRVHMAHLKHPLIGDATYGPHMATKAQTLGADAADAIRALNRQALHAGHLAFEHPTSGETMSFSVEPHPDMVAVLDELRRLVD